MKDNYKSGFIFGLFIGVMLMVLVSLIMLNKTVTKKTQPPKQEVNQTYQQDSLCQVWVDSTHLRVAFKTWYNKNKGEVK